MKSLINETIVPLIADGRVSSEKVRELTSIKELIDRVSDKKYLVNTTPEAMKKKYGSEPTIVTWGDYFQVELAMSSLTCSQEDFSRMCDTVRFDLMAAWDIFSSNPEEFQGWVMERSNEIYMSGKNPAKHTEDEQETMHLRILLDYYTELHINGNFYESELIWYHDFFSESATGTDSEYPLQ